MIVQHITPDLDLSGSVAIVGSSAKLRDAKYGKTIDGFDHVLRFNRAPTEGHEEYAGSKTTLRIVNGHVFMSVPFIRWKEDHTFVKKLRNTKLILSDPDPDLAVQRNNAIDHSIELYTIQSSLNACFQSKVVLPTVGLMGIMLIVLSGIRPIVFGWSTTIDEPMSHYFNKRSPITSGYHKWETEILLINQLIRENKIEVRE